MRARREDCVQRGGADHGGVGVELAGEPLVHGLLDGRIKQPGVGLKLERRGSGNRCGEHWVSIPRRQPRLLKPDQSRSRRARRARANVDAKWGRTSPRRDRRRGRTPPPSRPRPCHARAQRPSRVRWTHWGRARPPSPAGCDSRPALPTTPWRARTDQAPRFQALQKFLQRIQIFLSELSPHFIGKSIDRMWKFQKRFRRAKTSAVGC